MADSHEEGLMEKIQVLVAPPQTSSGQKARAKKTKPTVVAVRHGNFENNPYCDACGDGGNLLCCDKCPSSFHFYCCDPPIDPKNLPSGEWLCRRCMGKEVSEGVPPLFRPLLEIATSANPLIFNIPFELQRNDMLPGSSRKHLSQRVREEREEEGQRFCFICNKSGRSGLLVSCDFCPLVFHLDCLDPPLATPPSSAWMCPIHPNHKTPGFDHPRLTERLRAMSECRADVAQHSIKIDFIHKINRIPHYKRLTRHHNRRATEVPPAVKSLYASPLADVLQVSPLSESLLTPGEEVEKRRREEERERREFTTPRPPALTQEQDEWTRRAVLCQLEQKNKNTVPLHSHPNHLARTKQSPGRTGREGSPPGLHDTLSASHSQSNHSTENSTSSSPDANEITPSSTFPDFSVFLAAHKLLELSGKILPNGFKRLEDHLMPVNMESRKESTHADESEEPESTILKRNSEEMEHQDSSSSPRVNSEATPTSSAHQNASDTTQEITSKEDPTAMDTDSAVNSASPLQSPTREEMHADIQNRMKFSLEAETVCTSGWPGFVPDVRELDVRLVHLLASQRIQQLFGASAEGNPPEDRAQRPLHLNGLKPVLLPKPAKPAFSPDALGSAPAILCPVSGIGSAYPFHKMVTSIGTGSEMDVCLLHYGHCNFLSPRHACVFYDKGTDEYELINYSDHGSVVDGVLYSCDFSDKGREEGRKADTTPLSLDDLVARGSGLRAARAKIRLEAARKDLGERERARRALEAAIKLARPSLPEVSTTERTSNNSSRTHGNGVGLKRTAENSSVVSIPLSKTKKLRSSSEEPNSNKKENTSERTQEKLPSIPDLSVSTAQKRTPASAKTTDFIKLEKESRATSASLSQNATEDTVPVFHQPCLCKRSASSLVGSNGKGWEGTATLYHGSKLRLGCVQFVLSIAGRPGHSELVKALLELHRTDSNSSS